MCAYSIPFDTESLLILATLWACSIQKESTKLLLGLILLLSIQCQAKVL